MVKQFKYNDKIIEYVLEYKEIKLINIRIGKNHQICVSAPRGTKEQEINDLIQKNIEKIIEALEKNKKEEIKDKVVILGKVYDVKKEVSKENKIEEIGNNIIIYTKQMEQEYVEKLYYQFLIKTRKQIFVDSLNRMYEKVENYHIPYPKLVLKKIRYAWGICRKQKNEITINVVLLHYDIECIDYVVLHELAHFKYQNHKEEYYRFIESIMPNYKEIAKRLE